MNRTLSPSCLGMESNPSTNFWSIKVQKLVPRGYPKCSLDASWRHQHPRGCAWTSNWKLAVRAREGFAQEIASKLGCFEGEIAKSHQASHPCCHRERNECKRYYREKCHTISLATVVPAKQSMLTAKGLKPQIWAQMPDPQFTLAWGNFNNLKVLNGGTGLDTFLLAAPLGKEARSFNSQKWVILP